jgi:hypothetical protein
VHVQLNARVVVGLDTVLQIVSRPRADRLTRCAGYVIMVTRLGWQSCCSGELLDDSSQYGETTMEEPELGFQIG